MFPSSCGLKHLGSLFPENFVVLFTDIASVPSTDLRCGRVAVQHVQFVVGADRTARGICFTASSEMG